MKTHIVFLIVLIQLLTNGISHSQTLIINEVSNGPSGSQEYVEFVVVDVAATYDCDGTIPPCVDIRGWIYDDNSGYHGTSGIASGAARFTNDPLWSCVPVGTIILLYNGLDPNIDTPADDVSLTDGNCVITVALENPQYFEFTETTPGDIVCSYPATGWGADPSPNWSNVAMANGGDCSRLVDLNGCEVFSLCYGSANLNPMIYFNSGGSGTDNNWYFNGGDPNVQANWSEGCAGDISACGSNDQTPGAPNNQANADYIGQFNNYCSPIPPLVVDSAIVDATCGCTGIASITATGSIPGYTYEWYDATWTTIGQTNDTATGLCPGMYYAIATSSIGCEDTISATINSGSTMTVSHVISDPLCFNNCDGTAALTVNGGVLPYTYAWNGSTSSTNIANDLCAGFQSITITDASGCFIVDTFSLANPLELIVSSVVTNPSCFGLADGAITLSVSGGTGGYSFLWDNSGASTSQNISNEGDGTYTVTVTDGNNCTESIQSILVEPNALTITSSVDSVSCPGLCDGGITASASGGTSPYLFSIDNTNWNTGFFTSLCDNLYTIYIEDDNGCLDSLNTDVPVTLMIPDATIGPVVDLCENISPVQLFAASSGGVWSGTGITNTSVGIFDPSAAGVGTHNIIYTISGSCSDADTVTIDVLAADIVSIAQSNDVCEDAVDFNLSVQGNSGNWSGVGIVNSNTGLFSPATSGVGDFTIYYTTTGICPEIDSIVQTVLPIDTPTVFTVAPMCEDAATVNLAANIPGGLWSGQGVTDVTNGIFDPAVAGPGSHIITYDLNSQCSANDVIIIIVDSIPNADISLSNVTGCVPLVVNITNSVQEVNQSCVWDLGNGNQVTNCNDFSYTYTSDGCYDISVDILGFNGCSTHYDVAPQVCTDPSPNAYFTVSPTILTAYNSFAQFTNESSGANNFSWTVDSVLISNSFSSSYDFSDLGVGNYDVCLEVENSSGCTDKYCVEVVVNADFSIYVPNSFTPNGDGHNDLFSAVINGPELAEYSLYIFDRWGTLFFNSDEVSAQWDGTLKGNACQQDVYVWKITYREPETSEMKVLLGHVSLIR